MTTVGAGRTLHRVYDSTWGHDEHNPGFGDARFSPIDDPASGARVQAMYLAQDVTSALLETAFHDVHPASARIVYDIDLIGKMLAYMRVPTAVVFGDLRNGELADLGISRDQVVSSPAEHYPCTRRLSIQAIGRTHQGENIQGLVWHSRQAELAGLPDAEVFILFGSRYNPRRGSWKLFQPGIRNVYEGAGRVLVDEIADQLGATVTGSV